MTESNIMFKLTDYGSEALSDQELLSLFVGMEETQELFEAYGSLAGIARKSRKQIEHDTSLGKYSSALVVGLYGISERIAEARLGNQIQITNPADGVAYFGPKLRHLTKEVFIVAFLNNAKRLTGWEKVSSGGSTATIVDPAEVMRQAVINEADSILLTHNHPSGSAKESRADINLTKRLAEAGKLLGIPVDDHIIIGGDSFTSLKSKGIIK